MRRNLTLFLGLIISQLATSVGLAADLGGPKELGDVLIQNTPATHFIWTDNNWYTTGSTHTLRWTFDPQGDAYPYTLFVYRENIRTGERMYVSNNSLSAEVRDVQGNALSTGGAVFEVLGESVTVTNDGSLIPNGRTFVRPDAFVDSRDGNYLVRLTPKVAGTYLVAVTRGGDDD